MERLTTEHEKSVVQCLHDYGDYILIIPPPLNIQNDLDKPQIL